MVDPLESLRELGRRDDHAIDIAEAALLLAAIDRPGENLSPYRGTLAAVPAARESTGRLHSIDMQVAGADWTLGRPPWLSRR